MARSVRGRFGRVLVGVLANKNLRTRVWGGRNSLACAARGRLQPRYRWDSGQRGPQNPTGRCMAAPVPDAAPAGRLATRAEPPAAGRRITSREGGIDGAWRRRARDAPRSGFLLSPTDLLRDCLADRPYPWRPGRLVSIASYPYTTHVVTRCLATAAP